MAQGRLSVIAHSRAEGHSVAAALAYRGGLVLEDTRTGEVHDYSGRVGRQEIAWSRLIGVGADTVFGGDVQAFADAMEQAEKRINSRIGRDVRFNLPHELPLEERIELATTLAQDISARYHTPCKLDIHRADLGDERNDHGHLYLPTRALDGQQFGKKLRVLDARESGGTEIRVLRAVYESRTNMALQRAGLDARIDMSRQLEEPQPRLGRTATAAERAAAIEQSIDPRGIPMSELVCRIDPVTPQGRALRDHEMPKRELEAGIERDERTSREQAGALYHAELVEPEHLAVEVKAPERRRRKTREERRARRAPRRAERGEERARRRRAHHQAQVQGFEVQRPAQSRPAPARRVPMPTVAAPIITAERPRRPDAKPAPSAFPGTAAPVVTSASRPRRARPPARVPVPTVATIPTVPAERPRQMSRRLWPSASVPVAWPAQMVTSVSMLARRAQPSVRAPIRSASVQPSATPSKPAAGAPARPVARVPAARSGRSRARFVGTEILELPMPATIQEVGAHLAEDPATVDTDWADCYNQVLPEHATMRAVLAAAHEHDAERRRKGEVPVDQVVFMPEPTHLQQILEWIHEQLTTFTAWLRRFQQVEREIASPGKRVDSKQAQPLRPTITFGGRAISLVRPDARDPSRGPPQG